MIGSATLLLADPGRAQEVTESLPAPKVITSVSEFWGLSVAERARSHPFRIECDVTYYDTVWKNLWIQDATQGGYVSVGNRTLPIESGQHIIVTGTFEPPNKDLSFEYGTVIATSPANTPVLEIGGKLGQTDIFGNRLVSLEAFVVRQYRVDPWHLQMTLSTEGETITAYVSLDSTQPVPDFSESTIQIRGVYVPQGSDGLKLLIEMRVPGVKNIVVVNWLGTDPRFKLPVTPIENLTTLSRQTLVKVAGRVKGQEVGRYLRIRDATGQVDLITNQDRPVAIDEEVEAIGYPAIEGTAWKLNNALFRSLTSPLPLVRVSKSSILRLAAQVLELPPQEAKAGRPVLISGVVTWAEPSGSFIFVQDASGGVCVERGALPEPFQEPGRSVEIRGHTSMGSFAPVVTAETIVNLGEVAMPAARQVSVETAQTGVEEAQWVEMRGYLSEVTMEGGLTTLDLTTTAGTSALNFLRRRISHR